MTRYIMVLLLITGVAWGDGLQQATNVVRQAGYKVVDSRGFIELPLQVLVGQVARSNDGYAKKAFFFYRGRYLGNDTAESSALVEPIWQDNETVALLYILYRPQDPLCCPTGGGAIVRYHWNGSRLSPLDPIPPSSEEASLSRR